MLELFLDTNGPQKYTKHPDIKVSHYKFAIYYVNVKARNVRCESKIEQDENGALSIIEIYINNSLVGVIESRFKMCLVDTGKEYIVIFESRGIAL